MEEGIGASGGYELLLLRARCRSFALDQSQLFILVKLFFTFQSLIRAT